MNDPADAVWLHNQLALARAAVELSWHILRGDDCEALGAHSAAMRLLEQRARSQEPSLLVASLQLGERETRVLFLLAAASVDAEVRRLLGAIGETPDPTLATLQQLLYEDSTRALAFRELAPDAPLRRLGLIERSDGGAPDLHESRWTWAISRRMLALLHGDLSLDPEVAKLVRGPVAPRAIEELAVSASALAQVRTAIGAGKVVVACAGAPGLGRRSLLAAVAKEAGIEVLAIEGKKLAKERPALERQLRAIARECVLLGRTPLVCDVDALGDQLDAVGEVLLPELAGPILVTTGAQRTARRWDRPVVAVELSAPTSAQRARLWHAALGQGTEEDAEYLATRFPLAPAVIHHAARAALARVADGPVTPDDIYAGIRAVLEDRLGDLARRVTVTQTWDDLVLAEDQVMAIAGLVARIRQRRTVYEQWGFGAKVGKGLGTAALFSGPPGTGKTMVAALIARELGLELYQVDMAKITSKWIGETEKHLAALFDAAEAGHAILLFDEADSLFGKRTEVRSSNDRHANLETNYLLQRLESFSGICLLTSNHEANIDPAFQRRLSLHVRFELPDEAERARLWRAMLPAAAPVAADVDYPRLARRYAMSGGYIRNAALRAAFLAADEACPIDQALLEQAAALEYEGMGKIAFRAA